MKREKKRLLLRLIPAAVIIAAVLIAAAILLPYLCRRQVALPAQGSAAPEITIQELRENGVEMDVFEKTGATRVIDVTKKGVVTGNPDAAGKNTEILNRLIALAGKNTELFFPDGTYYFGTDEGGLRLQNKEKLILEGQNAKLVNVAYSALNGKNLACRITSCFFLIDGCTDIVIRGFEFDYLSHTTADGVITAQKNGMTTITAYDEFTGGEKTPLAGGELVFAASCFDADGIISGDETYFDKPVLLIKTGEKEFRVPGRIGKPGQQISLRFSSGSYASPMFYVTATAGFSIQRSTVRSCPSAVLYAPAGNADFCFDGFSVEPYEGSEALLATNEDCIHIKGLRGSLVLKNGSFAGLGDDVLNVHSRLLTVESTDGNRVAATDGFDGGNPWQSWAVAGDKVEFFDSLKRSLGTAVLKSFTGGTLVFDSLPPEVTAGCYLQNLAYSPLVGVTNCYVERGRARAFLLQVKNAVVRDCTVRNMRLAAVLVSPDFDSWLEGGFAENMLICGNTFERCCLAESSHRGGVVWIGGCHDAVLPTRNGFTPHKNVSVTDNTYSSCGAAPLYAWGVENLEKRDNKVR